MEVACTAKRNFDRECKKTFATKSAITGREQMQQEDVPVARLLDHLVGAPEQRRRHVEAKRLRSLEIKYEFDLGRRLDGQVGGFLTLENPINVRGCAPVRID